MTIISFQKCTEQRSGVSISQGLGEQSRRGIKCRIVVGMVLEVVAWEPYQSEGWKFTKIGCNIPEGIGYMKCRTVKSRPFNVPSISLLVRETFTFHFSNPYRSFRLFEFINSLRQNVLQSHKLSVIVQPISAALFSPLSPHTITTCAVITFWSTL